MARKKDPKQLTLQAKKPVARMSDGYYSGDKPNPNLRNFIENHLKERPYNPETDDYDIQAFSEPIKASKATVIYNMHAYWSKKPHDAIRKYIEHYTRPGDLVLDSFCGSGGTALVASFLGRKAVAIDASPSATFITRNYLHPISPDTLLEATEELVALYEREPVANLYKTVCHITDKSADILRTIYSARYRCKRCLRIVPLFDCPMKSISAKSKAGTKQTTVCPYCLEDHKLEELSARNEFVDRTPVAIEYRVGKRGKTIRTYNDSNTKARKYFEKYDLSLIEESEHMNVNHWYPDRYMLDVESDDEVPWGLLWRPYHKGMRKVEHFFTRRNLISISTLMHIASTITTSDDLSAALVFGITGILPGLSFMNRYRPEVSFPLNYSANTLYVPPVGTEENPIFHLLNKIKRITKGYQEILENSLYGEYIISTDDACHLDAIPDKSIDYIFIDPPYGSRIQYSELNFLWESWLRYPGLWRQKEIIVNESVTRGLTINHWKNAFFKAMKECFRVLKPGRWLSLCFHDSSTEMWWAVQDVMLEVGFVPDYLEKVVAIETDYLTHKQSVADQIAKRDLIINFQKLKPHGIASGITISGKEDERIFREKVLTIIHDYLLAHPGATKDRIYDEVVSRLVHKGSMEAFDFDMVLNEVAYPIGEPVKKNLFEFEDPNLFGTHEVKRWYLKDAEDRIDEAEAVREDAAAEKLETFMTKYLKKNPEWEGVHYSDLFEQIVTMDRPRREMADWLIDYFYKTEEGTWRPPLTDEEREEKAKQRATGALRKIKSFARLLESDAVVPERLQPESEREIAEWVHQARRAGLFHQGKVIFEKSGLNLSRLEEADENLAMDMNEDYQYCLKQLGEG